MSMRVCTSSLSFANVTPPRLSGARHPLRLTPRPKEQILRAKPEEFVMSRLLSCAMVSAMLMPASLLAQEITLVDATINHPTSATVARALPQGFPADLTTPMDYAGGTL